MNTPIRTTGELGPLLKRLRKAKNMSQTDLGRRIGLSQERISVIERQPEKVTMDNLLTVLMALGVHFAVVEPTARTQGNAENKAEW
ncbi:helix-turn-helix domain-containing protein [Janthinobacterium sp. RB2R34]|uniref:helix-turn-helix domain-containing protein n=1 Tax=Janthinobacterium sp. RB2R34 TaxID=3424193 RepID=UPI003F2592EA